MTDNECLERIFSLALINESHDFIRSVYDTVSQDTAQSLILRNLSSLLRCQGIRPERMILPRKMDFSSCFPDELVWNLRELAVEVRADCARSKVLNFYEHAGDVRDLYNNDMTAVKTLFGMGLSAQAGSLLVCPNVKFLFICIRGVRLPGPREVLAAVAGETGNFVHQRMDVGLGLVAPNVEVLFVAGPSYLMSGVLQPGVVGQYSVGPTWNESFRVPKHLILSIDQTVHAENAQSAPFLTEEQCQRMMGE